MVTEQENVLARFEGVSPHDWKWRRDLGLTELPDREIQGLHCADWVAQLNDE